MTQTEEATQTEDTTRTEEVIWLTEDQQRVWRAYLLGSARLNDLLDAGLRRFGLDLAEYEILVVLSESDEEHVRMSDLARAVHQSKSRLTHTISRLERADLVRRTSCPTDRRGVWAVLTDAGLALLEEAAKDHVRTVRENFVEVVRPSDYAALGRAFAAVAEHTAP